MASKFAVFYRQITIALLKERYRKKLAFKKTKNLALSAPPPIPKLYRLKMDSNN